MIENNFKKILKIIALYYDLDYISEFVLDLQVYNDKYNTEARIWLTAPNNHLGINLMLYSIKLNDIENKEAIEVFSEYMKFYAQNSELFKTKDGLKFNLSFEISNRWAKLVVFV